MLIIWKNYKYPMFGKIFTNLHFIRGMQHLELHRNYFDQDVEVFNKLKPLKTLFQISNIPL